VFHKQLEARGVAFLSHERTTKFILGDVRSRQEVCKRTSGGGLPDGGDCRDFETVGVAHATEHVTA